MCSQAKERATVNFVLVIKHYSNNLYRRVELRRYPTFIYILDGNGSWLHIQAALVPQKRLEIRLFMRLWG
jgi:hypothetical protein